MLCLEGQLASGQIRGSAVYELLTGRRSTVSVSVSLEFAMGCNRCHWLLLHIPKVMYLIKSQNCGTAFSCSVSAPTFVVFVAAGIAVPEAAFYTLELMITEASGAECRGTTCYSCKTSDFPDLVRSRTLVVFSIVASI